MKNITDEKLNEIIELAKKHAVLASTSNPVVVAARGFLEGARTILKMEGYDTEEVFKKANKMIR